MLSFLCLALYGLCAARAFPTQNADPSLYRRAVVLPSADPFYAAPANLSDYAPGEIIRSRNPPGPLAFYDFKTNLASAWQLLYRTTGAEGEPLATVTTVLIPHGANFGRLLSYQVEIDAPFDACFPSITLQQPGANLGTISSQYGELWFISALQRGWIVAVPDHEGPHAAFASGIIGGHATLDGLRAVLQSKSITGVLSSATTVIWGYSGGAQATEFALELHQDYAPDLNITAAAIGGAPANLGNALPKINKSIGAGIAAAALLGQSKAYPAVSALINQRLFLNNASQFLQAQKQCLIPTVVGFAFQDIATYFNGGFDIINEPAVAQALQDSVMGQRGISKIPTYIYHSLQDELVPVESVEALVEKYCASGANIQFTKEALGEHVIVALTGAAGALGFLIDRMDGRPFASGCTTRTVVSSALDPRNIQILGEIVFNDILAILGAPVGPLAWLSNAS